MCPQKLFDVWILRTGTSALPANRTGLPSIVRRFEITNNAVPNHSIRTPIDFFAVAEEWIVNLGAALLWIETSQQQDAIVRDSELSLQRNGVPLLHHQELIDGMER